MTYYTVCPDCGYKLFKAGDGSNIEIYCPKCKAKLIVEIKDGKIIIQKVLSDKTQQSKNLVSDKRIECTKVKRQNLFSGANMQHIFNWKRQIRCIISKNALSLGNKMLLYFWLAKRD